MQRCRVCCRRVVDWANFGKVVAQLRWRQREAFFNRVGWLHCFAQSQTSMECVVSHRVNNGEQPLHHHGTHATAMASWCMACDAGTPWTSPSVSSTASQSSNRASCQACHLHVCNPKMPQPLSTAAVPELTSSAGCSSFPPHNPH